MQMRIGSDTFVPLIGGVQTRRGEAADGNHPGDTLVDGGGVQADRCA